LGRLLSLKSPDLVIVAHFLKTHGWEDLFDLL
jgi:hypothetical protein